MGKLKVIVTGGGTGGHLFPGIAIANGFVSRFPETEVLFIGPGRQLDATALARTGFPMTTVHCQGLKGKSLPEKLLALVRLPMGLLEAIRILRQFKPTLVCGVGGYVTGPVILAAKIMHIATCIHEQNSIPGLANRWLGKIADRIFLSIPGSEKYFHKDKSIFSGNPVRPEIIALARDGSPAAAEELLTVLVLGGSLGAHRLNELVVEAMAHKDIGRACRVIHQTGGNDQQTVRNAYDRLGVTATVADFFHDMAAIYRQADVVISRAGATTIAELTVLGKPVILIPYPFAADNHQRLNGQYLVDNSAAVMFEESGLNGDQLAAALRPLLTDTGYRQAMAGRSRQLGYSRATETIIDSCLEMLTKRGIHV